MQVIRLSLIVLFVVAQMLHRTIPSLSASIGGNDDSVLNETTTLHPIQIIDDHQQQSQGDRTSDSTPSFPTGRFGWEIGIGISRGYQDGSILVRVGNVIELRIGYDRTITEVLTGDRNYIGRPLADYYPALHDYLDTWNLWPKSKEGEEVLALFKELDSQRLTSEAPGVEEFDDGDEDDDEEDSDETAKRCPICGNRLGDDNLILECQHGFHIRCIWDWKRKGVNTKYPICRHPFDI